MNKAWWSKAVCEVCGCEPAYSFSFIRQDTSPEWEAWTKKHNEADAVAERKLGYGEPIPGDEFMKMKFSSVVKEHRCPLPGCWKLAGECSSGNEMYYIEFRSFFANPQSTTDWLAHMYEKPWFNPEDFFAMLHRFRAVTKSFHKIAP